MFCAFSNSVRQNFIVLLNFIIFSRSVAGTGSNGNNGRGHLRVWHVSDFHIDLNYDPRHGSAKEWCHFDPTVPGTSQTDPLLGRFGYESNGVKDFCDSPYAQVEALVKEMGRIESQPDFIIWTGDTGPHIGDDITRMQSLIATLANATRLLKQTFPGVSIFSSFGNRDYPFNYQFPDTTNDVYNWAAEHWLIDPHHGSDETMRKYGYYSGHFNYDNRSLLVISLNTLLWSARNRALTDLSDPGEQFKYLESQMGTAEANGERVIMIGHIPPGIWDDRVGSLRPQFNKRFLDIVTRYTKTIVGLYFGHLHRDLFSLIRAGDSAESYYYSKDEFVNYFLAAPTSGSNLGQNAAVRLVELSRTTGELRSIEQYYLNLTAANQMQEGGVPSLQLHYNWTVPADQGVLEFLIGQFEELKSRDPISLDRFINEKAWVYRQRQRTDQCRQYFLCAIVEADFDAFDRCMNRTSTDPQLECY